MDQPKKLFTRHVSDNAISTSKPNRTQYIAKRRHSSWEAPKVKLKSLESFKTRTDGCRYKRKHSSEHKEMSKHAEDLKQITESTEREKNELKSKIEELEQFRTKYNEQKEENERLQRKVDHMLLGQSDVSQRLLKTTENLDKARLDNKKKADQIDKYQRDVRYMEDRMRNLEIRASEVEKAELILETTRQNLDSTQTQVRAREKEIRLITQSLDESQKQLKVSNDKISDMEEKMKDLNYQVRHELIRNESIEKNLETIPRLKEEIDEKENKIQSLEKEVDEKTVLLSAARKAARDYRDQIRDIERTVQQTGELKKELHIAQSEVSTLKKLMQGKDYLVAQKSKAFDLAKEVIDTMRQSTDKDQMNKIYFFLEKIANNPSNNLCNGNVSDPLYTDTESSTSSRPYSAVLPSKTRLHRSEEKEINVNKLPYPSNHGKQRPKSSNVFLDLALRDSCSSSDEMQPKTAVVRPTVKRTSSFQDALNIRSSSSSSKSSVNSRDQKKGFSSRRVTRSPVCLNHTDSKYGELQSFDSQDSSCPDTPPKSAWLHKTKSDLSFSTDLSSMSEDDDNEERPSSARLNRLMKLNSKEREEVLCKFVHVGDRILIRVPQKPPKYGKKIVPKPKVYTGIVKYIGTMDKPGYDPRTSVGVRLDSQDGDTDGSLRGKRYMYTPADQGKFFKLIDVDSVLDIQSGRYRGLAAMLAKHILNT